MPSVMFVIMKNATALSAQPKPRSIRWSTRCTSRPEIRSAIMFPTPPEADGRHHHGADREVAVVEDAEVEDGLLRAQLANEEADHRDEPEPRQEDDVRRLEEEDARHEEADDADRQVDVEDPAPRPVVADPAADGRPEDRRHHDADAP